MFYYEKNIFSYNKSNKNIKKGFLKKDYLLNLRYCSNIRKNIQKDKNTFIKKGINSFNYKLLKIIIDNVRKNKILNKKNVLLDKKYLNILNNIKFKLNLIINNFLKKQRLSKIIINNLQKNILYNKRINLLKKIIKIIFRKYFNKKKYFLNNNWFKFVRNNKLVNNNILKNYLRNYKLVLKKNYKNLKKDYNKSFILEIINFLLKLKKKFFLINNYNNRLKITQLNKLLKIYIFKFKNFLYEEKNKKFLKTKKLFFKIKKNISQKITFRFSNNNLKNFLNIDKNKVISNIKLFLKRSFINKTFNKNKKYNFYSYKYSYYFFLYKYLYSKIKSISNLSNNFCINKKLKNFLLIIIKLRRVLNKNYGRFKNFRIYSKNKRKIFNKKNVFFKKNFFYNKKFKNYLKNISLKQLNNKIRFLLFKVFSRKYFNYYNVINLVLL